MSGLCDVMPVCRLSPPLFLLCRAGPLSAALETLTVHGSTLPDRLPHSQHHPSPPFSLNPTHPTQPHLQPLQPGGGWPSQAPGQRPGNLKPASRTLAAICVVSPLLSSPLLRVECVHVGSGAQRRPQRMVQKNFFSRKGFSEAGTGTMSGSSRMCASQ